MFENMNKTPNAWFILAIIFNIECESGRGLSSMELPPVGGEYYGKGWERPPLLGRVPYVLRAFR